MSKNLITEISFSPNNRKYKVLSDIDGVSDFIWNSIHFFQHPTHKNMFSSRCGKQVSFHNMRTHYVMTLTPKRVKPGPMGCGLYATISAGGSVVAANRFVKECIDNKVYVGNGERLICISNDTTDCSYDNWKWETRNPTIKIKW